MQNDLEGLMKHSGDPVTPQALSSRDINNMTAMHKVSTVETLTESPHNIVVASFILNFIIIWCYFKI